MGSTAMRKVVGRIPLARDEARSLSRSARYSRWICVSRAGAAQSSCGSGLNWAAHSRPSTCARCRYGGTTWRSPLEGAKPLRASRSAPT